MYITEDTKPTLTNNGGFRRIRKVNLTSGKVTIISATNLPLCLNFKGVVIDKNDMKTLHLNLQIEHHFK